MNTKTRRIYSRDEETFLRRNYRRLGGAACATSLDRSLESIQQKAVNMGIAGFVERAPLPFRPGIDPTLKEIEARAEAIRSGWSRRRLRQRSCDNHDGDVIPQGVKIVFENGYVL